MSKLLINKSIFKENCLYETIKAFKHIANITVEFKPGYYVINFDNAVYDVNETMMEFENYLIDVSVHKGN